MGEEQVFSAAMDVEGLAQVFHAHRRAFDMPAGTARAPGAVPGGFARLGSFPQRKIRRVFLIAVHVYSCAGFQIVHVLS